MLRNPVYVGKVFFRVHYNTERPHRSLADRTTPEFAYRARPKAAPGEPDAQAHDRVRHDVIDRKGRVTLRVGCRKHHVGIGTRWSGTRVLLLVHDLEVRVVDAVTGELIRELVIEPTRDYQPTGSHRGPNPDGRANAGSGCFLCPAT